MKRSSKIMVGIIGMMCLLVTPQAYAQWTTVKAAIRDSDVMKVTGTPFQNYKGIASGTFEIVASVDVVKDQGKVSFRLTTKSINMVRYDSYAYRPYLMIKDCIGAGGELRERQWTNDFLPQDIGTDAFEQARRSAYATFDVEITFIVKDEKYGISGFGAQKGWGYRATRVFKNVKADGVFWADEPIETSASIEEIKILNHPKLVSFKANDAVIQTAVESFIKERNEQTEAQCKEKAKANDAEKQKKEEDNKKAEASAKEIEAMKNKLQTQINITSSSTKTGKAKADDFWSGGTDKSTASAGKDNDDFWSGGRDKTASNDGGSSLEAVNKDGRIYLKDAYDIIKEWDANKYSYISKLSNDFFRLSIRTNGNGFLSRNNIVIVDKQGNTVMIDGEEVVADITPREGGGYTVIKYLSESLYNDKLNSERWTPRPSYTSSSEAINDTKANIGRIKEKQRQESKNGRPGVIVFVSSYTYDVVHVKEIITNDKIQGLITKADYKIR